MTDQRKVFGNRGESLAEEYLKKHDYKIIEKNWRCRVGEIDLIIAKEKALHFVEVKTRENQKYGSPLLAVHAAKQKKIRRLAEVYLATRPFTQQYQEICFGCLGIMMENSQPKIEWLPRAFGF